MNSKCFGVIFSIIMLLSIFTPISQIVNAPGSTSIGSSGLADSPWPMFRQNINHTGLSPFDTSGNNGEEKWHFNTGNSVLSSPSIDIDGTIYVGSNDFNLYAINPDGSEKWNFTTGGTITSSPTISNKGTIYVGSADHHLYAVNPNGTEKWNYSLGGRIRDSSPTINSDGTIYIGCFGDRTLYALNPNGTLKWTFQAGPGYGIRASPVIWSDGTIYFGSGNGKLYAINPDGTEKWSITIGNRVQSSPAIGSDGTIYVGSMGEPTFHAINPDGTVKWSFDTGSPLRPVRIISTPAINSDGVIYFGSHPWIFALYPNGTEKWRFTTGNTVDSSPAIGADGTIYVGSENYKVYAINADGTEKWNFTTGDWIFSSPAIGSDGTIYIGSGDHNLYAIGNQNIPPIALAGSDQTINEGDTVHFNGSASYDPDGTIEFYEWDFDSSDGLWWETGAAADSTGPTPTHVYGDDGIFVTTLRITDNDNLSATDICNITVLNVDPTIEIESAIMNVEIGLRVTGRKFNDVGMTLFENGTSVGYVSIERLPGSPIEQMVWFPMTLDLTKTYSSIVTYIPEDPPNIGANPVWIHVKSENGSENRIHHTFNVQQSKKRDSEHWNHVEPWEVDLNPHLIGLPFEVTSHITDPGSDDETLSYEYGSQIVTVEYLNNPPISDPFPSPEVNPRDIIDTSTFIYEGSGTIKVIAKDDDNIRLGIGEGLDSIDIV
jgi:outer membrane protein assembly factor BamB